jgi:hypothetical protein
MQPIAIVATLLLAQGTLHGGTQKQAPAIHTLDLLGGAPAPSSAVEEKQWLGPPPVSEGSYAFPFSVTIKSVDRSVYELEEQIVYELELTNTSAKDVLMPWQTASSGITPQAAGARRLTIYLEFNDQALGAQDFGFQHVFGASDVPGSLREIHPGETVEIRASARLSFIRAPKVDPGQHWSRKIQLRAINRLSVAGEAGVEGGSSNVVTIELRR